MADDRFPCCATWDANILLAENGSMRAVLDSYPVRPGHALVYPRRHVDRLAELRWSEMIDLLEMIGTLQRDRGMPDSTIAVNDGAAAGRTIGHLHVHVVPVDANAPLEPGGIRRLFISSPADDPWTAARHG